MNGLRVFWEIACLRKGPQDVPYSTSLLAGLILLHAGIDLLLNLNEADGLLLKLSRALLNVLFMAAFTFVLLQWQKRLSRYVQSLSALMGGEFIIGLFGAVLMLIYQFFEGLAALVGFLGLGLVFWNVLIAASVFRHALDTSMGWGALLAILYLFLAYNIVNAITPIASTA